MSKRGFSGGSSGDCGRKEDLIAYLYHEADNAQCESFEAHLVECVPCREELRAFGRVREDLGSWQLGFIPRTEFEAPKRGLGAFASVLAFFPLWARGAALAAVSAAVLIAAISLAGIGRSQSADPALIESKVREAVAAERGRLEQDFSARMASLRKEIEQDHEARMAEADARYQARIQALQAGFRSELRRNNRQGASIRSFFAMEDNLDPFGVGR